MRWDNLIRTSIYISALLFSSIIIISIKSLDNETEETNNLINVVYQINKNSELHENKKRALIDSVIQNYFTKKYE